MKNTARWAAFFWLLGAALLVSTALRTSLVYDEVIYAPMGLLYWTTGDFSWNPVHPPLQKLISSIPMLLQGVTAPAHLIAGQIDEWRAGYQIFFQPGVNAKSLIFLSRLPSLAVTLLLAWAVYFWMKRHHGPKAGWVALAVLILDPLLLANGALAMNDIFVSFFMFIAILQIQKVVDGDLRWKTIIMAGVLSGCAVATKFSGILLLPIAVALAFFPDGKEKNMPALVKPFAVVAVIAAVVLAAFYRFDISLLWRAVLSGRNIHQAGGDTGFLLRQIPGNGTWYYYPIAVLIKTPLPLLLLWLAAVVRLLQRRQQAGKIPAIFLIPAFIFLAAAMASHNHFGLRYLLPAVPFLAGAVGWWVAETVDKKDRLVAVGLIIWLAVEAVVAHPNHLAYFNQLVGGSKNGWKWLDGSNQDWGQDLPALARLINKQNPRPAISMGYWGSNRPEAWGIEYQDVLSPAITNTFRKDRANEAEVPAEWLVVSAELRHNPATQAAYVWLDGKKPLYRPSPTLFVYDISQDRDAVLHLAEIYAAMGRRALYERQLARAALLQPAPGPQ